MGDSGSPCKAHTGTHLLFIVLDIWMNGETEGRMERRMDAWRDIRTDERRDGGTNGEIYGQKNGETELCKKFSEV